MDLNSFIDFLVIAKKNTYAANKNKVTPLRPGAVDLFFEKDGYKYVDSYFGSTFFSGQEVVYKNEKPFWSMNYYGKVLRPDLPEGFTETLKEALLLVNKETPFRGPDYYQRENYEFQCENSGSVLFFNGEEHILYNREEVYRLYFHGGILE